MKTKLALLALCLLLPLHAFGQKPEQQPADPADPAATGQAEPIPEDLPACMARLDAMLGDEDKAWLREHGAEAAHFGLGMWIRNNWGLWHGDSPLPPYFRAHGIHHPDCMSGLILECYVQHLNGEEVDYEHMIGEARRAEEEWRNTMEQWEKERKEQEAETPSTIPAPP
jgi:hypothetical protein